MAWSKNGTTTAGSATDNLQVDVTATEFNFYIAQIFRDSGDISLALRYDNDSSTNYAIRSCDNGGADGTATSFTLATFGMGNDNSDMFGVSYGINISGEEKLNMGWGVSARTAGAGTAPFRRESVAKWITSTQFTRVDAINNDSGNWAVNSNFSVLNGDTTEETILANVQSGSRFEATDTRKIYYAGGMSKSGIKAYYNFEQTSGNLINQATTANGFTDGLGSTVDGINNGATSTTGKVGSYAWNFASDNLQLSTSTSNWNFLHNGNSYSIAMWIKFSNTGNYEYILSDIASSSHVGIIFIKTTDKFEHVIYRGVSSTTALDILSTTTISDTDWHHYALTFDGTTGRMYVDGSLDSTQTTTNSVSTANSSYSLKLGSEGSGVSFFNGNVDELAIFNRVLTADEVSYLYNSGTGRTVNSTDVLGWTEEV